MKKFRSAFKAFREDCPEYSRIPATKQEIKELKRIVAELQKKEEKPKYLHQKIREKIARKLD